MFENGRGNDDGVNVGSEQLFEVLVGLWRPDRDLLLRHLELVIEEIAERGDLGSRVGLNVRSVAGAAVARSDQADGNLGIRLRATDGFRSDDRERRGNARRTENIAPGRAVMSALHENLPEALYCECGMECGRESHERVSRKDAGTQRIAGPGA